MEDRFVWRACFCWGRPTEASQYPQKPANPFDYGGGIVKPNKAAKPGLVYDMSTGDYLKYLCTVGYNDSSISQLVGQSTYCPSPKPSILDVNLPSITIPNLRTSVTLTRTVTNVGPLESIYKVLIEPPLGVHIAVRPEILAFNSTVKALSFAIEVSTTYKVNTGYYFGRLTWTDGVHAVTIPISVKTQIIQFYTDDN
ncbi:Peptidase S8, subtilisin-related [Parasponia andersonii]|uniref:Peptidase S8, subtilisin-related n=1 Tax=Parasponia andersonii TaxID=3476 RepID=A0A2P5AMI2_PARAD|nr:Peptidase S8, subtilisin-related [Parasponia andersonii]